MGLPLEPDIAPEDEALDPFIEAPEVRALAFDVMNTWDEFASLRDALHREEGALRIAFVFETKPYVEGEVVKTHTIAKVTKASPLWSFVGDIDLVIQFRMPFWEAFDERQRRGVLHHEMSHVEFPRGKLSLREHDVEDFVGTMRRYGPITASRRAFLRAGEAWFEENPEPPSDMDEARARRRPPPSGSSGESVARVAQEAARGLLDAIPSDTEVTVTADGRSVTARGRGRPTALPGERIRRAEEDGDA